VSRSANPWPPRWWLLTVIVLAVAAAVGVVALVNDRSPSSPSSEPPPAPAEVWQTAGFPNGRGQVWTRCDGSVRLWITLDVSGDPVGPVGTQPFGDNGCPR
jgi:hypothetical protein